MKNLLFPIFLIAFVLNAHAQLKVNWNGHASVASSSSDSAAILNIGQNPYYGGVSGNNNNIAIAAKPLMGSGYNIAVEGWVSPNQSYPPIKITVSSEPLISTSAMAVIMV